MTSTISLETNSIKQRSSDIFCNSVTENLLLRGQFTAITEGKLGTGNREEVWAITAQLNPPYLVLVNLS